MNKIAALFLLCFATALFGQAPPLIRNPLTTNNPVAASNYVFGTGEGNSAASLRYISPLGGNNGLTDMLTNTPTFIGQLGVSLDWTNIGGGTYLWSAKHVALGSNGWGAPIYLPGFGGAGAQYPFQPKNANIRQTKFHMMGNPGFMDRTNVLDGSALADTTWQFVMWNPYGYPAIAFPNVTTNEAYSGGVAGTNAAGQPVYWDEEAFGFTIGGINREWPAGRTNQAASYVGLLGGAGSTKPFYFSDNHTEGGQVGQHAYFAIVRSGLTNAGGIWGSGFAIRATNAWHYSDPGYRWNSFFDYNNGDAWIATNGSSTAYFNFIKSLGTNNGANVFGGNYESRARNNFNGETIFNAPGEFGFNHLLYGGGAVTADNAVRLGVGLEAADYPFHAYAAGVVFQIKQNSNTDLLTGLRTAGGSTNVFVIDNRRAYFTNVTGLDVVGANVGTGVGTIAGAGNGNTNYTLLARNGRQYLGSSNVNISAVMGYTAGLLYQSSVIITNLSANTWGIGFSAVTNRWKFLGPNNQTNSPTVLTNGTALRLSLEIEGTNVLANWEHFAPGL